MVLRYIFVWFCHFLFVILVTYIVGVKFRWWYFSWRRNIVKWSLWRFNKSTMWFRSIWTPAINTSGMVFTRHSACWRCSFATRKRRRGKFFLTPRRSNIFYEILFSTLNNGHTSVHYWFIFQRVVFLAYNEPKYIFTLFFSPI